MADPRPTVKELRALYEKGEEVLTLRRRAVHAARMALRKAIKRRKRREAIQAKRKRRLERKEMDWRDRVVAAALDDVGIHESPGTPNADGGGPIDRMNRDVGMSPGPHAYWCGSAVHKWLKAGGLDYPDWIRYTPTILAMAQQRRYGLSCRPLSELKPGDMVLMNFDGGAVDHVAVWIGHGETVEGNTSPGTGGSQNDGGGVYKRTPRGTYTGIHINRQEAINAGLGKVAGKDVH